MSPKKRLGRGLDALLGNTDLRQAVETPEKLPENELKHLAIDLVQRGKYQPRREMDQESLQELANSIMAQGVMQPIVVRSVGEGRYEIKFCIIHRYTCCKMQICISVYNVHINFTKI